MLAGAGDWYRWRYRHGERSKYGSQHQFRHHSHHDGWHHRLQFALQSSSRGSRSFLSVWSHLPHFHGVHTHHGRSYASRTSRCRYLARTQFPSIHAWLSRGDFQMSLGDRVGLYNFLYIYWICHPHVGYHVECRSDWKTWGNEREVERITRHHSIRAAFPFSTSSNASLGLPKWLLSIVLVLFDCSLSFIILHSIDATLV